MRATRSFALIFIGALSNIKAQEVVIRPNLPDTKKTLNTNWIETKTHVTPASARSVQDIVYYDGLGYPTQQIGYCASPHKKNILQPIYYDEMLRDSVRTYLPVVTTSRSMQMFAKPFAENRYLNTYGSTEDGYVYAEANYDNSISNRKIRTMLPGKVFRDNQKATTYTYGLNRGDSVVHLSITTVARPMNNRVQVLQASQYWEDGALYKTSARNEDGSETITFADAQSRILLTRTICSNKKHDTYYVYDALGRLCWVVPPKGAALCEFKIMLSSIYQYCYIYVYDNRNRIIQKQLPGCEPELFVYNFADQVVMSQDGNLRKKNQWIYNQYDAAGRPTATYQIAQTSRNQTQLQQLFDSGTACDSLDGQSKRALSYCMYDKWDTNIITERKVIVWPPKTLNSPIDENIDSPLTDIDQQTNPFDKIVIDSDKRPIIPPGDPTVLEDLKFVEIPGIVSQQDVNPERKGYKTYEKIAVYDPDIDTKSIKRAFYYDRKGRLVQVVERNFLGAISRMSFQYDFCGNVIQSHETHQTVKKQTPDSYLRQYVYDDRGRMLSETSTLNGAIFDPVTYTYDELGRLATTSIPGGEAMPTTTYSYNLQGWLTSKSSSGFSMNLRYYDPNLALSTPSYSGNISEWEWRRGPEATSSEAYSFTYDKLSRLSGSQRFHYEQGQVDSIETVNYAYDANGNMTGIIRKNKNATEDLVYQHTGNQLTMISPRIPSHILPVPSTVPDFQLSTDVIGSKPINPERPDDAVVPGLYYAYDAVGNMRYDTRHKLVISYNPLNLAEKISRQDTVISKYLYLWDGTKLCAKDSQGNGLVYLGSLVYDKRGDSLTLESASFGEGRIAARQAADGANYSMLAFQTDHLGSVRGVVDSGNIVEHNDYDPFGRRQDAPDAEISDNRYRYNGKEEQAFVGNPYQDYGARMYDSQWRMRWNTMDPMAEKYYSISPYAFCANNPIKFVDPNGADIWEIDSYGFVVRRIEDTTRDAFYLVDENGNRINGSKYAIEFAYGTVKDRGNITERDKANNEYQIQIFEINDSEKAQQLFEIMSNNTSNVEWSLSSVERENNVSHIVGNTHTVGQDVTGSYLKADGYNISEHIHNHPFTSVVSGADESFSSSLAAGSAQTYIYKNNGYESPYYFQYNSKGIVVNLSNPIKKRLTPWYR